MEAKQETVGQCLCGAIRWRYRGAYSGRHNLQLHRLPPLRRALGLRP